MTSRRIFLIAGLVSLLHVTASFAPGSARAVNFLRLPVTVEDDRQLNLRSNITALRPEAAVIDVEVRTRRFRMNPAMTSTFFVMLCFQLFYM